MANPDQIEQELRAYLDEEGNLSKQDRIIHLKAIFDKHFGMDKADYLINGSDVKDIIYKAKITYADQALPIFITKNEIFPSEVAHVLIMESLINYLNKVKLLKRLVRFDYLR